jgi:Fe-S-cluster containining protein
MTKTVTTVRQAINVFFNGDPELLKLSDSIVARLSGAWNISQGQLPATRFIAIMRAADGEIDAQKLVRNAKLPCASGCHHCCVQEILISTTEAILVVRHIERQMSPADRAARIVAILAARPSGEDGDAPCALLASAGTCSVYADRPMCCRSYLALSEPACRIYRTQRGRPPEVFRPAVVVDGAVREVTRIFRHARRYEINALLRRIYSDPSKPALWANDEPTDESDIARA